MVVNAAYTNPANYTITGPSTVAVLSVSAVSATQVQLVVSPDLDSLGSYTVTASNVTSVYGHPLDTLSDSYTFYAPLVAPIVAPFVTKTAYAKQPGMSLEFLPDCGFVMVDDETALQDNIRTLMSLHKGEVLLDHDLGNPLYASLFDQNDVALWLTLDTAVRTTVNTYEPRVDIKRVVVSKDAQTGDVVNMQVDWISKQSKVSTSTQVDMPYGDSL
jgi:phage baseplate assembly protein W